jgi:reactive intermediate/imine deaminase
MVMLKGRESMDTRMPTSINPEANAIPGGHYSHGTVANGFVFVSGQLPITKNGDKLTHASFADQARQVLANVEAVLRACGSGIDRLVQVRVYVDSVEHWPEFNAIYAQWAGNSRPSRAIVPTGPLHHGLKVEVEAVAVVAG